MPPQHLRCLHTYTNILLTNCSITTGAAKWTHTCTKGIGGDKIKRKLVGNLGGMFIDILRCHPKMSLQNVAFKEACIQSDLPRRRDLSPKSKRRKHLVTTWEGQHLYINHTNRSPVLLLFRVFHFSYAPVIVLDDIAYRPDGRQVLIDPLRVDVVQRLRRTGISVGPCEVNGHLVKCRERQQPWNMVEKWS